MVKNKQDFIPIHVWLKTFLLINVIFWGIIILFKIRDKKLMNPKRITVSNYIEKEQKPDIYILGSSLTKYALCEYNYLDSSLFNKTLKLNYKIIYKGSVVLDDYNNLILQIKKVRPSIVFIESNIACINMSNYSISRFLGKYSIRLSRIPRYILTYKNKFFSLLNSPVTESQSIEINESYWKYYNLRANNYKIRKINDFPEWNLFFEYAHKNNIQIIFLEFPRSEEAKKYLPKEFQKKHEKLIQEYKKLYSIKFIPFPYNLDQKTYFNDAAHLNKEGTKFYTEWLVNEFIKLQL